MYCVLDFTAYHRKSGIKEAKFENKTQPGRCHGQVWNDIWGEGRLRELCWGFAGEYLKWLTYKLNSPACGLRYFSTRDG